MHARRKSQLDTSAKEFELQRSSLHETLQQFQIRRDHHTPIQFVPKQTPASSAYGEVPNDLDRIAYAATENEVLDLVNQVLDILHRSGRIAELPQGLRVDKLANRQDVRIALRKLQGDIPLTEQVQWESDALCVLRAVLSAADERVIQLRRKE